VSAPSVDPVRDRTPVIAGLSTIVGFLVVVEVVSGVLQGYYTPIFSDIARHLRIEDADVNWFEAGQLIVSALMVPLLSRLGDLWGHRQVLLLSTAVTALASWGVALAPDFWTFLVAWSLQGFYVVWLPMEVALVYRRAAAAGTAHQARLTRRSAALLVAGLEAGVIAGALTSGALVESVGMTVLLALPAWAVTICFVVIWWGVAPTQPVATGRIDLAGFLALCGALGLVMTGLILVRVLGPGSVVPWLVLVAGVAAFWPFTRLQLRTEDPLVDMRLLGSARQWPVQLTAFLFGVSVLGAQIPLSTFARTDPAVTGYGLGASAGFVSTLIGVYVVALLVGALLLPVFARVLGTRGAMLLGCLLVALGYGLFLPFHDTTTQTMLNMAVAGLGSGTLVAALPAAAAAAAPADRTGFVTGMTNTTKTIGGAIASAVFAIALAATGSLDGAEVGAAPLSGYLTVWTICSLTAVVAAASLLLVPRGAFAGAPGRG
jgi:MFS family permease